MSASSGPLIAYISTPRGHALQLTHPPPLCEQLTRWDASVYEAYCLRIHVRPACSRSIFHRSEWNHAGTMLASQLELDGAGGYDLN